jgi:hypothetical protein
VRHWDPTRYKPQRKPEHDRDRQDRYRSEGFKPGVIIEGTHFLSLLYRGKALVDGHFDPSTPRPPVAVTSVADPHQHFSGLVPPFGDVGGMALRTEILDLAASAFHGGPRSSKGRAVDSSMRRGIPIRTSTIMKISIPKPIQHPDFASRNFQPSVTANPSNNRPTSGKVMSHCVKFMGFL